MQPCVPTPRALGHFFQTPFSDLPRMRLAALYLVLPKSRLSSIRTLDWGLFVCFWIYFDMLIQNTTVTGPVSFSKLFLASKRLPRGTLPPLFIVALSLSRTIHLLSSYQPTPISAASLSRIVHTYGSQV